MSETDSCVTSSADQCTKKVIHFCDGSMIEESDVKDEEEEEIQKPVVDPKNLTWGPWLLHQTLNVGSTSLKVCDYLGEHLADFFGITSPKYQYEIEEYNRMKAEEEEERKQRDLEEGGWVQEGSLSNVRQGVIHSSKVFGPKKIYIAPPEAPHKAQEKY